MGKEERRVGKKYRNSYEEEGKGTRIAGDEWEQRRKEVMHKCIIYILKINIFI